jgi:hypothetical protein
LIELLKSEPDLTFFRALTRTSEEYRQKTVPIKKKLTKILCNILKIYNVSLNTLYPSNVIKRAVSIAMEPKTLFCCKDVAHGDTKPVIISEKK